MANLLHTTSMSAGREMLRNSSNSNAKEFADITSRDSARRLINVNSNMRKMEVNLPILKPNCV